MSYLSKLKSKWRIKSNFQLFIILLVFALTGSSSLKLTTPILEFLNITKDTFSDTYFGLFFYWCFKIIIIFPIYQIILLFFSIVFFQFKFFWTIEKKMLSKIGFKKFFND